MSIFKKPAPAPTLSEKHEQALASTESALALFDSVANRLEHAAVTHDAVVNETQRQIDELLALQVAANDAADRAERQADKIRDLLG